MWLSLILLLCLSSLSGMHKKPTDVFGVTPLSADIKQIIAGYLSNDWIYTHTIQAHKQPITGIFYAPNRQFFASIDAQGILKIWNAATYQCIKEIAHNPEELITAFTFSSHAHACIYGTSEGTLFILAKDTFDVIEHLADDTRGAIRGLYYNNQDQDIEFLAERKQGIIKFQDTQVHIIETIHKRYCPILYSPEKKYVVWRLPGCIYENSSFTVFDMTKPANVPQLIGDKLIESHYPGSPITPDNATNPYVRQFAFSPNNNYFVYSSREKIGVYNLENQKLYPIICHINHAQCHSLAWTEDGRWLIHNCGFHISLHDVETKITTNISALNILITYVIVSSGGMYILAGCQDGTIRIFKNMAAHIVCSLKSSQLDKYIN
jgi:WD40 repeat protein